jgi:hypothetical protein
MFFTIDRIFYIHGSLDINNFLEILKEIFLF